MADIALKESNLERLKHFLRMGHESGCYQPGLQPLPKEKITCLPQLIDDGHGEEAVALAIKFYREKIGTRVDTVPFVLAQCAHSDDAKTKQVAYDAVNDVCETPKELFAFVKYSELLCKPKSGWGRAQRKVVSKWYNSKDPKKLAELVTKYISSHGWTHKDLLRLSHLVPAHKGIEVIAKYIIKGWKETKQEFRVDNCTDDITSLLDYLEAVEELKHVEEDYQKAARLIEKYNFSYEHVTTHCFKNKEVWAALIPHVPLSILLQNLPKLTRCSVLKANNSQQRASSVNAENLIKRLQDESKNPKEGLCPTEVYLAKKRYEDPPNRSSGHLAKHKPIKDVTEALQTLLESSKKNIPVSGKRFIIAVDVRNPMEHGKVVGCSLLNPNVTTALLIWGLLNSEKAGSVKIVAFSNSDMKELELKPEMKLEELKSRMRNTQIGAVDCANPILWAKRESIPTDVFVICTDSQTKAGPISADAALQGYRKEMKLPHTKLVVCAMGVRNFTVASTDDPGMLDIGGFDSNVPKIISHFAQSH